MRKIMHRFLPLFLILFLLDSSLYARSAVSQSQKTFLWKAQSKTGIVYVLGSLHLMKKESYPLNAKIENAFEQSNVLAVEANISDIAKMDLQKLMQNAFYQGNETIERHVSRETYELIKKETGNLGMPLELIIKQKPWFLSLTLTSLQLAKLGFDPNYGIDNYFLQKSVGRKKIVELESIDYQLTLLSGFSEREQELFLLHTLRDMKTIEQEINQLLRAWISGDVKSIESLLLKESVNRGMEHIYEKLFYERNRNMTSKIEGFLRTRETYFVVIGAGHLVGNKGIIEILKRKGYSVEQI
ncbi:MAG: TraB/GumN family protein [Nitrospirae bacterium]|nr:TraB/GumN family protein [Nitrospirota bacterium]MCL5978229.1 TraB/GumN family protein [Nitrospirota bacterium]